VDIALESGAAFSGDGFQYIKPALAEHTLHFIGLLSDGGEASVPLQQCLAFVRLVPRALAEHTLHFMGLLSDSIELPVSSCVWGTSLLVFACPFVNGGKPMLVQTSRLGSLSAGRVGGERRRPPCSRRQLLPASQRAALLT